jgi:hypothetical protein
LFLIVSLLLDINKSTNDLSWASRCAAAAMADKQGRISMDQAHGDNDKQ